jgi:hypothetical protein
MGGGRERNRQKKKEEEKWGTWNSDNHFGSGGIATGIVQDLGHRLYLLSCAITLPIATFIAYVRM